MRVRDFPLLLSIRLEQSSALCPNAGLLDQEVYCLTRLESSAGRKLYRFFHFLSV